MGNKTWQKYKCFKRYMEENWELKILAFKVHKSLVFKLKFRGLKQCFRTFPFRVSPKSEPVWPSRWNRCKRESTSAKEMAPVCNVFFTCRWRSEPYNAHTSCRPFSLASSLCKAPSNLEKRIQSKGTHLKNQLPALCLPWLEKDSGCMILESAIKKTFALDSSF